MLEFRLSAAQLRQWSGVLAKADKLLREKRGANASTKPKAKKIRPSKNRSADNPSSGTDPSPASSGKPGDGNVSTMEIEQKDTEDADAEQGAEEDDGDGEETLSGHPESDEEARRFSYGGFAPVVRLSSRTKGRFASQVRCSSRR